MLSQLLALSDIALVVICVLSHGCVMIGHRSWDLIGGCFLLFKPSLDTANALDILSGDFTTSTVPSAAKTPVCSSSKTPVQVRLMNIHIQ